MSSDLFSLIKTIENACDETIYTVADTEHLVRLAVAEYILGQNALVASARAVDQDSVQKVIDRHITANISAANPYSWFSNIAPEIANFIELAYEGTSSSDSVNHVDLLPIGHPRSLRNFGLVASAHMDAVANWVAADPRISTEAGRQAVYNAYRSEPGTLESDYATAKLDALCASGVLPEELSYGALVASFKNMSFAERSARSKALAAVRRRDRRKRFADEFGRLRGFFSKGDGTMFTATGQIVGAVPNKNSYNVEFDGSNPDIPAGIYEMDASKSENVKATLSKRALSKAENLRKPSGEFDQFDQDSAVDLKAFLKTRAEAPSGWTKAKDGSFTSSTGNTLKEVTSLPEGDYFFEGLGENNEQDLGEPLFEIKNEKGELLGVSQDWAGAQKIALTYDELKPKDVKAKKATAVTDESVAEALDSLKDETNWGGSTDEPEFKSPNGVLDLSFTVDADTDGEGGMQDASGWNATLDPDGEEIDLGSWLGSSYDSAAEIAEKVQKAYEEYKAKQIGSKMPEIPEVAPIEKIKTPSEKSKPSYLDQKPKSQQATLKKYSRGYVSDGNQDINVDITDNKDGTYTVDHGYNFLADENATEFTFDEGAKTFPTEQEALDFANEKLAYYNSKRVDEDAANDAFDQTLDSAPERGLGQDVPEVAPVKEAKPLSAKQLEPASPKQYALLKELQEERDGIDANQTQAINDALENQNLSKAQMATLFGELTKKPFKPEIDPSKPSDRMINSLRDYLVNKELTEAEISDALDQLEAGLDRDGVEKLLAKLRRRPDKAKEDGLGQTTPKSLENLSAQDMANGYYFDKETKENTWSATGFPEGEETSVEVSQNPAGKWFTTERSGGNGESGFTRESEKQHATPQEAFDYASDVLNRSWDQGLFEDLQAPSSKEEEPSDQDKIDAIDTLADSEDYEGLSELLEDPAYAEYRDEIIAAQQRLKDDYIDRREAAKTTVDSALDDVLATAESAVADEIDDLDQRLADGEITQEDYDKYVDDLNADLDNFRDNYMFPGENLRNSTGVLDKAVEEYNKAYEEFDKWYQGEPADLSEASPGNDPVGFTTPIKEEPEQGLGQAAPSTKLAEGATDAQYGYISSMLNSKIVPDDIAETVRQSLEGRNLSKAQVGELIGKMRDLPDNADFDPSAPTPRMIDSVKRNIVAKGLSKEDQDAILAELPNMDKASMSELIGRLKAMDDVNAPEEGLGQTAPSGSDSSFAPANLSELGDDLDASEETAGVYLDKADIDRYDLNDMDQAYQLADDLEKAAFKMKPTTEEGKKLQADLKKASDDIKKNIQDKIGPIEAAKFSPEDGTTLDLDRAIDDLEDFFDYYYPSDADDIADRLREGSVGDVRGGGWEGSVKEDEDGNWVSSVTSPESDSDSYEKTFDNEEDAIDWTAASVSEENSYPNKDAKTLEEGGVEALVKEYGDNPSLLVSKLMGVADWLRGTNRGQAEKIATQLVEYATRIEDMVGSSEQGLGQVTPKA